MEGAAGNSRPIFGVVNILIRPVTHIVGLPRTCLTFGLFALVIYLGLLALTAWIAGQIGLGVHIAGFCAAFGGVIIFRTSSAS